MSLPMGLQHQTEAHVAGERGTVSDGALTHVPSLVTLEIINLGTASTAAHHLLPDPLGSSPRQQ
jgi:hypothetical protein